MSGQIRIVKNEIGDIEYFKDGVNHNDDGPAFITQSGYKEWYKNGVLHNENGPAIEYPDGCYKYYLDGKLHRIDGPAVKYECGTCEWYVNGIITHIQRPNEEKKEITPEEIEEQQNSFYYDSDYDYDNSDNEGVEVDDFEENYPDYKKIDKLSEWDEVTTYYNGIKEYRTNGEFHREDGPAVDFTRIDVKPVLKKFMYIDEYYLFGQYYSKLDYEKEAERIRKLKFKYFHRWYDRLDDLSTSTGQRRMIENYEKMKQL